MNKRLGGLDNFFDHQILSNELKISKPNPEIYEIAVEKTGLKPPQLIFIDDKEKNLVVPRDMGINVILCENYEQVKNELENTYQMDLFV